MKKKLEELARLRAEAKSIIENPDATADELAQADEWISEAVDLQAEIKAMEEREKSLAALEAFESEVPGRKAITDPLETIKEKKVAAQVRQEPDKFKTLGEQLQAVARVGIDPSYKDSRLDRAHTKNAPSGLSESVPSDGGFLVQADFAAELIKRTYDNSQLLGRCRRIPISGNSNRLVWNSIDETSRADGSRWGGVQASWTDEADTTTASDPKVKQQELALKKLRAVCYATEELLADSTALESLLGQAFAEEMNFKIQDGIVNGTGVGQPKGLLNDSDVYVRVSKETGQAATTVVAENIFKMWSRLYAPSRGNSVWLINQDIEPQLYSMALNVGTGGAPVYLPPGGLSQSPYSMLYGRPVIPIEQCQTLGTLGDIILTDMSQYLWIDKGGMDSSSSVHVRFLYDEMTYKFTLRCNGMPMWRSSLTPYKGTNTQSPIVVLQSRS